MLGQYVRHLCQHFCRYDQRVEDPGIRQLCLQQGTALRRQVRLKIHQLIKRGVGYTALLQVGAGGLYRLAARRRQVFLIFQFSAAGGQFVQLPLTVFLLLFAGRAFLRQRSRQPLKGPVQNLLHGLFLGQPFIGGDQGKQGFDLRLLQTKRLGRVFQRRKGLAQRIPHGNHHPLGFVPLGPGVTQGLGGGVLVLQIQVQLPQSFLMVAKQFRRLAQPGIKVGQRRLFLPKIQCLQVHRVSGVTQLLVLFTEFPERLFQLFRQILTMAHGQTAIPLFSLQYRLLSVLFLLFPVDAFLLLFHLALTFRLALYRTVQITAGRKFLQLTG